MREAEMVRGHKAVPSAVYMFRSPNVITEFDQTSFDNPPGAASIMSLKIPDILKDQIVRSMLLKNSEDLSEEGASCLIAHSALRAGLGERLAGKPRTENVVRRDLVLELSDIAVHETVTIRKILEIELS
jgi:hypothetical protein